MSRKILLLVVLSLTASIVVSQFMPTPRAQVAVMVMMFFLTCLSAVVFCELRDRQCLNESKTPGNEGNLQTLVANLIIMTAEGEVRMSDALEKSQFASHLKDLARELHAELERIWPGIRIGHAGQPGILEPLSGLMDYLTELRTGDMDPQCLVNVYIKTCLVLGRHRGDEGQLWQLHEYGPMQLTSFAHLLGRYLERFHIDKKHEADRLLSAFPFTPV